MPAVRQPLADGSVGLILPTLPQGRTPWWEGSGGAGTTDDPTGGTTTVGTTAGADPARLLMETSARAESLGAGALWACDHIFWHAPVVECLTALSVAAAATSSAALGSCVIQLPLRRAAIVAKQAASLQLLSGGRLVLGVGVGSHEGEYVQAGSDFHHRGRLLDSGIDELHAAWASAAGDDRGDLGGGPEQRYRQFPATDPVPVWIGGSSEAALRRAAARGDGWMPLFVPVDDFATAVERLAKEADAAGRPSGSVLPSIVLFVAEGADRDVAAERGTAWMGSLYGLPAKAFGRHIVAGTAGEIARTVEAYRAAGAAHVTLYVTDDDPLDQFAAIAAALGLAPTGADKETPS